MIRLCYLLIFCALAGCSEAKESSIDVHVGAYRGLVGKELSYLVAKFGGDNVKSVSMASHDPGENVTAFEVNVDGVEFLAVGIDKIESLLFRSEKFKTRKGVRVGQSFCEVIKVYPDAKHYFGFEDGGVLRLEVEEEMLVFNFDTSNLPIGRYVNEGVPSKEDKSYCLSKVQEINLQ